MKVQTNQETVEAIKGIASQQADQEEARQGACCMAHSVYHEDAPPPRLPRCQIQRSA